MAGQWKEGIADLENALKSMDGKGRYAGLVRGYLGVARWRSGDAAGRRRISTADGAKSPREVPAS
jgi:hypothetical protein